MPRKNPFPPEADTKPESVRPRKRQESAPAPKSRRERSEAPTLPPPHGEPTPPDPGSSSAAVASRASDVRPTKRRMAAATVDEVTADLSKDPRRERDDGDDGNDR